MKKSSVIALMLLICLMLSCCAPKAALRDELGEGPLTKETALTIVTAFNRAALPAFSAKEPLPYAAAYRFFRTAGIYDAEGNVRGELSAYQNGEQYHLPATLVEEYLLSKFDTEVDRGPVADYDLKSECYILTPAKIADTESGVIIDSLTEQEDGNFLVVAFFAPDPQNNPYRALEQTFVIEYDGEYRFRSFAQKEKPFQELSAAEQRLIDIIEDYNYAHLGIEFDEASLLTYDTVFPFFLNVGIFDEDGEIRGDVKPYATGDVYDPYNVPCSIVDNYLTSKFNTSVDPTLIGSYNEEDNTYSIIPNPGDTQIFYELIDCRKDGDVYTLTVKERHWLIADHVYTKHFVIEMTDTDYKYLAYSADHSEAK